MAPSFVFIPENTPSILLTAASVSEENFFVAVPILPSSFEYKSFNVSKTLALTSAI